MDKRKQKSLLFLVALIAIVAISIYIARKSNENAYYENEYYRISLPAGWIYTISESGDTYVVFKCDGTECLSIEANPKSSFDLNSELSYIVISWAGMHYFVKHEDQIAYNGNYKIVKLKIGIELSAAQEITGEEQPEDELHYYVTNNNKTFIDIKVNQNAISENMADNIISNITITE